MSAPGIATPAPPHRRTPTRFLPFAALALLAAAAAAPLGSAWLPCSDDVAFHLYRAVELGSQLAGGHLFPRWAPHMALGYGYPFFNFYAPLSSYGVVALHVLGLAYPAALKLAFGLGLWLSGVAAFLFVRELSDDSAGLAAGAAYLFAPYLAYDILFRGNLAESFAFVWPPLVLWALLRQSRRQSVVKGWLDFIFVLRPSSPAPCGLRGGFVVLSYAALILTHNIFALIASPLFAGYAALLAWQARSWRVLARGLLALAIGAALTTYFWAPALAERDLVHSDRLLVAPIFTWYTNFISPAELLAAPHPEDPGLINPSPARAVGLLPVLLGLPAVIAALIALSNEVLRRRLTKQSPSASSSLSPTPPDPAYAGSSHTHTLFFALGLLGYALLTLPLSTPIWNLLTPLALVQFPWRMLGPAALCVAVLIGLSSAQVAGWLKARGAAPWLAATPVLVVISAIYFGNLGWWYPRECPSSATASVADMVQFEIDSHTIGTTAKGEYIPRTAGGVPADLSLANALLGGNEPSRLSLPAGAVVVSASAADPINASYALNSAAPVTATYQQFYYPGWRVTIDGRDTPAGPDPNTGLIVFTLPSGTHTVRMSFGATPLRSAAVAVSLITLVGLLAMAAWAYWRQRQIAALPHPRPLSRWERIVGPAANKQLPITIYHLLLLLLLPVLKFGLIDRVPNPLRRTAFDPVSLAPVAGAHLGQAALLADFAGGLRLLGYDLSRTQLPADGAFDAALYLARSAPNDRRYWPAFDIQDEAGLSWQDPNYLPPRWQREPPNTPLWPLDQYAQWARHISLLPGTPPGQYTLYGSVLDLDSQQIASVLDAAGNAVAPRFTLGSLSVDRPVRPFVLAPPRAAPHAFGPIALLGYDLDRDAANAGDSLRLSLFWRSQAATRQDQTAQISLAGANGLAVYQLSVPPVNGLPTSQWQAGDEWRGQARLRLPAALPAGDYTLSVALSSAEGAAALGRVRVSAPARSFARPTVATLSGATFEGVGMLEGYQLTHTATALTVTLIWRATATPELGYSVFVHMQGADGRVWAQSDAAPADWTRPTTGWLPGEYVLDTHTLNLPPDLPAGSYTVWTGLYDPAGSGRVAASGPGAAADQRVALGAVILP